MASSDSIVSARADCASAEAGPQSAIDQAADRTWFRSLVGLNITVPLSIKLLAFAIAHGSWAQLVEGPRTASRQRGQIFRMWKEQWQWHNCNQSILIVPFDETSAHATGYDGIRVAAFEHLWALKLEVYRDRRTSNKGEKDARDIAQLAIFSAHRRAFDAALCAPYLNDEHLALLQSVPRSPVVVGMAKGNAVVAKRIRRSLDAMIDTIGAGCLRTS